MNNNAALRVFIGKGLGSFDGGYKIDRIEVMIDKSNHFISKAQMRSLIRDNPKVSSDMVFRHALKEDFSKYRSNTILSIL
jgi:hypothetical protein